MACSHWIDGTFWQCDPSRVSSISSFCREESLRLRVMPSFQSALESLAVQLTSSFAAGLSAQPEDQLKAPTVNLLHSGWFLNHTVQAKTEAQVAGLGGRPDIGVLVDSLLCGYIELKAPGLGAKPQQFRDRRNKEQWEKFKTLPNLIYTDGSEWSLFRSGQSVKHVKFQGDVTTDGKNALSSLNLQKLEELLMDFLNWQPVSPSNPKALAELLAPLCKMIRDDVKTALLEPESSLTQLADEWRKLLFPNADNAQFADAYAQTLTYAMLLARLEGAQDVQPELAALRLDSGHGLLAQALRVLSNAREDVGVGLDILIRAVNAIDLSALQSAGADLWLYFYEDFLGVYDRKLKNDYGVYYTPTEVIGAQVRLVSQLLEDKLGKPLNFASENVVVLDPATGTGAYPLSILQHALGSVERKYGAGMKSQTATQMAENIHGFEFLVGPYAVAHLRFTQGIQASGGRLPAGGVHVYLTDTLEAPHAVPPGGLGLMYRKISDEHRRAQVVKKDTRVLVCIGNPPYDRQQRDSDAVDEELRGGWVRFGDEGGKETTGILKQFLEPLTSDQKRHVKNLYNDYVYFWRWGLWKVFENAQDAGVICFITAASYLRGPGFAAMRRFMRQTLDELWIIDLEGDNLGARKTENVFAIRTPVCIAIGVRYGAAQPDQPAAVHYSKLEGSRAAKLEQLAAVESFESLNWQEVSKNWEAPFLPVGTGNYFEWPVLTDIFPWQHSGSQVKRHWPFAETKQLLERRWLAFVNANAIQRQALFRETRDRKISNTYLKLDGSGREVSLASLERVAPIPRVARYGYRSFDRHWIIADARVGDFLKPVFWQSQSSKQIYLCSLLTKVLGLGAAITISAYVPDMDYFCGRGGKDIIPLYRDTDALEPNVTHGILELLGETYKFAVSPEDLLTYTYGILASPHYVAKFSEELTLPGPRLPITKDAALFREVAAAGHTLAHWHTYAERGSGAGIPTGAARCTIAVPSDHADYPNDFSHNPQTQVLTIGGGEFAPVSASVYGFSVSGLEVVKSWLGYRMRERAGKKSSELDDIRPETWTFDMTKELLELLWVLEATISEYPRLQALLERVCAAEIFAAGDFPTPTDAERKASKDEEDDISNDQESLLEL